MDGPALRSEEEGLGRGCGWSAVLQSHPHPPFARAILSLAPSGPASLFRRCILHLRVGTFTRQGDPT